MRKQWNFVSGVVFGAVFLARPGYVEKHGREDGPESESGLRIELSQPEASRCRRPLLIKAMLFMRTRDRCPS